MLALGLLSGAATQASAQAPSPGHEWRPWPPARPTPLLDLAAPDGARWRLADQHGRVVVASFWATWCEPCVAELPSLQALSRRHAEQGLHVVAVNYRESAATVRRFVERQNLSLPVLLDSDGRVASEWTPRIFPSTVLVDREGRPAGVMVGEMDWASDAAEALLHPLLARR